MRAIVCADKNWGIGYKNRLLVSIPSDMKFFRETTTVTQLNQLAV